MNITILTRSSQKKQISGMFQYHRARPRSEMEEIAVQTAGAQVHDRFHYAIPSHQPQRNYHRHRLHLQLVGTDPNSQEPAPWSHTGPSLPIAMSEPIRGTWSCLSFLRKPGS